MGHPDPDDPPAAPAAPGPVPGGSRELFALAGPLILGSGFVTVQLTVDRVLLSWAGAENVAAALPAIMLFWLPFGLLQGVATYGGTFVAQYVGAGRPDRVGPAVWQGLYFSVTTGLLFLGIGPLADAYVTLGGHPAGMQVLEAEYLRALTFAGLPTLVTSTVCGFFAGRSSPWPVLALNAVGTVVNGALAYCWIFGAAGFPRLGIAGAGYGTAAGAWASAVLGLAWLFQKPYRDQFHTLSGWRFEWPLFRRLLAFGGPAGVQISLDNLAFTLLILFVGRLGPAAAAATSIVGALNLLAFMPMQGMGQAVGVLVGRRMGQGRPDLAAESTGSGVRWAAGYMAVLAAVYVLAPGPLTAVFRADPATAAVVPPLLALVAVYSLADSAGIVYASALRGAGDTRFVTAVVVGLAGPVMVGPAYWSVTYWQSVYWAWGFASVYIVAVAVILWLRFRGGAWQSMRVIEPAPGPDRVPAVADVAG